MKAPKRKPIEAWAVIWKGKFEVARSTEAKAAMYAREFLPYYSYRIVKLVESRGK